MNANELLSVPQAARLLGLSRPSVYRYIREGRLRALRVGRAVVLQRQDVLAFAAVPRRPGNPNGWEAVNQRRRR